MSERIPINQFYDELKECQKLLRELKKTADTNGTYNPFNKVYPWMANVVHEIRMILYDKIVR